MLTAIVLVILVLWLFAVISLCDEKRPWESQRSFQLRRREELRRKLTT